MDIKKALNRLKESKEFKNWNKKNKNTYFSYAFKIPQEMTSDNWQLGFYDKKKDKITTFVVFGDKIEIRQEEEIFKETKTKVNEIQIDKVELSYDGAIEKADEFQKKKFPYERSIKTIAVLQNLPNFGDIWNITYITESFKTLNMKIDASNGNVREHNLTSVFSFRKL